MFIQNMFLKKQYSVPPRIRVSVFADFFPSPVTRIHHKISAQDVCMRLLRPKEVMSGRRGTAMKSTPAPLPASKEYFPFISTGS